LRERKGVRQVVLTQGSSEVPNQKAEKSGVNSFIIQMVNGAATCRAATVEEIPSTLPRPDDRGVPARDLLDPDSKSQAAIRAGENSSTGLTINLVALSQLQSDANRATVIAAFERAAAIWTSRIKSLVTINVNIDYGVNHPDGTAFPSSVLGSTSSGSLSIDYPTARAHLISSSSSSAEAGIYNSLPASVVPTDTGDGSAVEVSRSLAQPLGLLPLNPNDTVATISFNKNFAFDFNLARRIAGRCALCRVFSCLGVAISVLNRILNGGSSKFGGGCSPPTLPLSLRRVSLNIQREES
jgi:hypothetical protein